MAVVLLAALAGASRAADTPARSGPADAALSIRYLGNEGFLLESGGKKVLIDALQGDGILPYVTLGQIRRTILERAEEPFGHVDLILATHAHRDHFDPDATARCLASNPGARFVSTEQAARELLDAVEDPKALEPRVQGFHPEAGKRVTVPVDGLGLEVMSLHHGKRSTAQNLGLIVEINGFRILHTGDTQASAAELADYGLANERFDVAFLPFWYVLEPDWKSAVTGAERIVAMHVPAANADKSFFGPSGSLDALKADLRAADPRVMVFDDVLDRRNVPRAKGPPGR